MLPSTVSITLLIYIIIVVFKQNTVVGTNNGAEPRNSNRRGPGLESWSNFVH